MDINNKVSLISICIDLEELSNSLDEALGLEGAYETDDMLQDVVAPKLEEIKNNLSNIVGISKIRAYKCF